MTVTDWEAVELEFGTGPLGPMASAGTWTSGWHDEFDTPGAPSTATWSPLRGDPATGLYDTPYSTANDASSWDPSYATVTADGLLELRWDNTPSTSSGITYPYTAGIVTSEGLRAFQPPIFIESRIWFTNTPGLWPSFWLNPVGTWPPEIDIAEFVPDDTPDGLYHPHFNYHWGTQAAPQQLGWQWYGTQGSSAAGAWHTYGLLWTPTLLQVFHDGAPGPSYAGSVTNLPHFLILSTGVRKGYTPANGRMLIDYVRTWTP